MGWVQAVVLAMVMVMKRKGLVVGVALRAWQL